MKNREKRIVIYGGAFNPPHIGHAAVIEKIARSFPCDEIWVMPSADSRSDKTISVSGQHRVGMLDVMVRKRFSCLPVAVKVSLFEIERPNLNTTMGIKMELEKQYPNYIFYFLIGSDLLNDIELKWVDGKELYRSANFLLVERPDTVIPKELPSNIHMMSGKILEADVSSTSVRESLIIGDIDVSHIVPEVASYIEKNKIFSSESKR